MQQPEAQKLLDLVTPLIEFLSTVDNNNIIAFGCNAGRHRSNIFVEELSRRLKAKGITAQVVHREY